MLDVVNSYSLSSINASEMPFFGKRWWNVKVMLIFQAQNNLWGYARRKASIAVWKNKMQAIEGDNLSDYSL